MLFRSQVPSIATTISPLLWICSKRSPDALAEDADEEEEALLLSAVLFPHPVSKKDDVRIPARNTAAIFFFIIFATPFLFCSGRSCLCFFCFLYCKLSGFRAPGRICRFAGYLTRNAVQYSAKMFSSALPADLRKIPSTDLPQRQRRFP